MFVCPDCGHSQPVAGACPGDQTTLVARGDDLLLGIQVGAYRIAKLLGVGGMGRVYKGVHPSIGSRVAVKVLSRECADRPDLVERFFSEARAVNLIRHESIVNVLDLAQLPDGRPYIIMEYLDGAPLADLVGKRGPIPLGGLARLIAEVLDALAAAHAKGIVHRDLKPDNIYVTPAGRPKVLDFGIAKLRPELGGSATQTGSLLGTPHYMSPEQALGKPVDLRTDIYAMGVILFECATGRRPFVAESLFDLLRRHVDEPPPPPRSLRPDMPPAFEQVIMYALAKDPGHRFQTCSDLATALMQSTAGLPQDQWTALTPSGSARIGAQSGPGSWGSQNTWPQSHPPGINPTGPGSHPPTGPGSHPGQQPPPPGSFAAGQVVPPKAKSGKGLLFALVGLALVGGGVAAGVVLTQGGGETKTAAGEGAPVVDGDAGAGAAIASGSADTEARVAELEKQLDGLGDIEAAGTELAKIVRTPPGGAATTPPGGATPPTPPTTTTPPPPPSGGNDKFAALEQKLSSFSSGIPECDAYVRTFVEMLRCPQLASMRDQYATSAEQMLEGFSHFKGLDKASKATAGQSCTQAAGAFRQAAVSMGCKMSPAGATPPPSTTTPPTTPTPPDPDIDKDGPYTMTIAGFNPKAFDFMKWLPTAYAEAKKHFPDAQLARIDANGVGPDGLVNFTIDEDWDVLYRFTSPSAAKKPAGHPAGVKWEPKCMVQIFVEQDDVTVIPMKGFGCEPAVPMPRCSAKQVWQKAIAKGAPGANAYAELWYGYAGGKWSFDIDDVFDEAFSDGC
ncbi:MAG TPA: serine/threonine-protein kinase [Kofleriaceae bacterium]|nr:serine/threonine-protein kinase [Kofleriaceae bacterium]